MIGNGAVNSPLFFSVMEEDGNRNIKCDLCPARCVITPGKTGRCGVRGNSGGDSSNGRPALPYYGFITAMAVDPIEKKPLYHFRPGSEIFSVGFAGCNLRCPFCQNWHISQIIHDKKTAAEGQFLSAGNLIARVMANKNTGSTAAMQSIAYTYSEPLVHIEFLLDCMKEARKTGIANVLVTNGCINGEAAEEVLGYVDAANIDLKCFSEETYKNVLGGRLDTVLDFIVKAVDKGVHAEITTLLVPGLNDGRMELNKCRDFIAELEVKGRAVPWHLSAYHPSYKWNAPATDPQFILETAKWAREKLPYVYTGNIAVYGGEEKNNNTICRHCGKTLVSRLGYRIDTKGLTLKEGTGLFYTCSYCGRETPIRY